MAIVSVIQTQGLFYDASSSDLLKLLYTSINTFIGLWFFTWIKLFEILLILLQFRFSLIIGFGLVNTPLVCTKCIFINRMCVNIFLWLFAVFHALIPVQKCYPCTTVDVTTYIITPSHINSFWLTFSVVLLQSVICVTLMGFSFFRFWNFFLRFSSLLFTLCNPTVLTAF